MLDIDKLKYSYEMPFLTLIEGLRWNIEEPSGNISYTKNENGYFYLSKRNNELHYCYLHVALNLRLIYSFESYDDVKDYVYKMW